MYAGVLQSEGLNLDAASFLGLFDQDKKFPVNCRMLGSTATSYQLGPWIYSRGCRLVIHPRGRFPMSS
jgi:hypothetical protein